MKEKDMMDMEKEFSKELMMKETNNNDNSNNNNFDDYGKYLENPQFSDLMNNYYNSAPNFQNGMN